MRNLLIIVFVCILGIGAKAQDTSKLRVEQYKVIVDVEISMLNNTVYQYVSSGSVSSPFGGWTGTSNSSFPPPYCYGGVDPGVLVPWVTCTYNIEECSSLNNGLGECSSYFFQSDNFAIKYNGFNNIPIKVKNYNLNLSVGTPQHFSDTTYLYSSQFELSNIGASINNSVLDTDSPTEAAPPSGNCFDEYCINHQEYYFHYPIHGFEKKFYPSGFLYDETKLINSKCVVGTGEGTGFANIRYSSTTRVRVVLNTDPVLTLPSHDSIHIIQTNPTNATDEGGTSSYLYNPKWKYSLFPFIDWLPMPATVVPYGIRNEQIRLSGFSLLGNDYLNHLNETILIRDGADNTFNLEPSESKAIILRLSSPHITNITPTHLNCFERNEGSLKIKFDRQLIEGERLNILLFDTVNRVNYSALNLDQLGADSSYTWPSELRAGVYFVSLIGKYAKGIPYDLYVNNRIDTVRVYKALNSINFEDGFNTTAIADTFDAATSFDGYSIATFTGAIKHFNFKELTQPTKIRAISLLVDSNVFCKGTAAGVITIKVKGGMQFPNNRQYFRYSLKHQDSANYSNFVNFTETQKQIVGPNYNQYPYFDTLIIQKIRNLRAGNYLMHIRDTVDCFARDSLGNEVTYAFSITEPEKAIGADFLAVSPITSIDSTNGHFNIKVTGGTQFPTTGTTPSDEAYIAKLYDSTATGLVLLQDNIHYTDTTSIDSVYNLKTPYNLHAGTYILKLYDRSYQAVDPFNAGCFYELHLPFVKPDTLKVKITAQQKVTCYNQKDAILKATASGGIPNDTTRYQFNWYRIPAPGQSVSLPGLDTTIHLYGDSIIAGLGAGTYRVKITDKYNNIKSDTFVLAQPAVMQLNFSTTPATCYSSFNGKMSVVVTGGTQFADSIRKYKYEWSNGALTRAVDSVAGGRYLCVVRDSMGCIAYDTVEVTAPVRVIATHTVTPITCYNTNNGIASVAATGGSSSYTYLWSNGATTATVTGLRDTSYWYKAIDSNGCFDTDTITLTRPDTILVNLGPDRKMCLGQILRLDGTVVSTTMPLNYNWQSNYGFTATTPKVNITDSARYILSVTDPVRNCTIRDTIKVSRIDSLINTDFIVSTQAFKGENVLVVNLSKPYPQDSILWTIPQLGSTVQMISQSSLNAQVLFNDTGRYPITMKVYYRSGCIDDTTKYVNVITKDNFGNIGNQANAYLKLYALVVPNPNPGVFDVQLTFSEATTAKLRLINTLTNITVDTRQVQIPNTNMFPVTYNFGTSLINGVYVLLIDTPKGSFVAKVVILH
jgi:SprB repeat